MKIINIIQELEQLAPLAFQESYDNAGLITGSADWDCSGVLCALDATLEVLQEAKNKQCNLVVAHHPILFKGLNKINGKNYVEQAIIYAIKHDIAIYAIHTNLDNVSHGVNLTIAQKLALTQTRILEPKRNQLLKLITFVPGSHAQTVQQALFNAGAGEIGEYSECSFSIVGTGTFKGSEQSNPTIGRKGIRETIPETRIEVILPIYLQKQVYAALIKAHPYETVAYDFIPIINEQEQVGSGIIGELANEMSEIAFLNLLKEQFNLSVIKHTPLLGKNIRKIAVCGGAGSFLISRALQAGADFFISADIKYHEFFDAENRMVIADIGHWESEQFTTELLFSYLTTKFPNFAVLKTAIHTNPVRYFLG